MTAVADLRLYLKSQTWPASKQSGVNINPYRPIFVAVCHLAMAFISQTIVGDCSSPHRSLSKQSIVQQSKATRSSLSFSSRHRTFDPPAFLSPAHKVRRWDRIAIDH